tara:strand:- start:1736 stop:2014 length:279 start_codon:yes stop_codon:yes gene_type:complete
MATKSERVTILTSPDFKAFLAVEAKKEGVSVSELIRVRCESPAASNDDEKILLAQLTKELQAATKRANASLDKGMKKAESVLQQIKKRKASA